MNAGLSSEIGHPVLLHVDARHTPPLALQWQRGRAAPGNAPNATDVGGQQPSGQLATPNVPPGRAHTRSWRAGDGTIPLPSDS